MKISLINAGKRFNRDWVFRNFNYEFNPGNSYAITGPNGSGKSTLLQVTAGAMMMSEGKIQFEIPNMKFQIEEEKVHRHVSIAAPYLEVIEEMTATEFMIFHGKFKPFLPGISIEKIIRIVGLEKAAHKQVRYYSSGMKQRVRLAQAIFSDVPCVLLDEPCTNLDAEGIELYLQLINDYCKERLLIISSNDPKEYSFCKEKIEMMNLKVNAGLRLTS